MKYHGLRVSQRRQRCRWWLSRQGNVQDEYLKSILKIAALDAFLLRNRNSICIFTPQLSFIHLVTNADNDAWIFFTISIQENTVQLTNRNRNTNISHMVVFTLLSTCSLAEIQHATQHLASNTILDIRNSATRTISAAQLAQLAIKLD